MRQMIASREKQKMIMELMCIQMREQDRLLMYKVLGVRHDNSAWPFNVKQMIVTHYQRGNRLVTFLKEFGYTRRGRSFQFSGTTQLDLPNIVMRESMAIDDLPAEVVNSMWLKIVLKRKQAAQKAKTTRWLNECKRTREMQVVEDAKRACVDTDVDEYSLGGF